MPQAEVRLVIFGRGAFAARAWTDNGGRVFFREVPAGAYVMEVEKAGYETARQTLEFVAGRSSMNELSVVLRPVVLKASPSVPGDVVSAGSLGVPKEARRLLQQGIKQLKRRTATQSIASFQKAVALHPPYAEAHAWLGMAYLREKKGAEAMQALTHAIELDPHLGLARALRGRLFLEEKDLRRAEDDLVEAVRIEPEAWDAHYDLARCYLQLGRIDLALLHARRAHDLPSAPAATHLLLFDIHLKRQDRASALAELEEFAEADPHSPLLPGIREKIAQLRAHP